MVGVALLDVRSSLSKVPKFHRIKRRSSVSLPDVKLALTLDYLSIDAMPLVRTPPIVGASSSSSTRRCEQLSLPPRREGESEGGDGEIASGSGGGGNLPNIRIDDDDDDDDDDEADDKDDDALTRRNGRWFGNDAQTCPTPTTPMAGWGDAGGEGWGPLSPSPASGSGGRLLRTSQGRRIGDTLRRYMIEAGDETNHDGGGGGGDGGNGGEEDGERQGEQEREQEQNEESESRGDLHTPSGDASASAATAFENFSKEMR